MPNCHQTKPDHESQVRPLIGLTPEQAVTAWERAAEKAGSRKITARLVKSAVNELNLAGKAAPVTREPRQTKAEKRRLIDDAIGLPLPKRPSERWPWLRVGRLLGAMKLPKESAAGRRELERQMEIRRRQRSVGIARSYRRALRGGADRVHGL